MIISDQAIKRPNTVYALVAILVVVGVYAYAVLPREAAPDVNIPFIIVTTRHSGVTPADMESNVTSEIETQLKSLRDVEQIQSTSSLGRSVISIEFKPKVDIDDALQKVRDAVAKARPELPDDIDEEPDVSEVSFSEFPIFVVNVAGDIGLPRLKAIAEDLKDEFERIHGVLDAQVIGGLEREIRIELDLDRMAAYQIPVAELLTLIGRENVNISGGDVDMTSGKYQIRVTGEFTSPAQIRELVLTTRDEKPIYLTDVATVYDTCKDRTSIARLSGQEIVAVTVQKSAGENILRIIEQAKEVIARMEGADEQSGTLPAGVSLIPTLDFSERIGTMVSNLENSVLTGFVLVFVVVLVSMGARNSFFVASAIPLSMLISFAFLHAIGVTLNMVVLFSLILALGMLVDNAIVIVENIYRHMELGYGRVEAAMKGTAQVAWPVIASTVTTVAAFIPLLFWPGIMGEFLYYLPLTVIVTLVSSLFVAMVINPVLCSTFMKVKERGGQKKQGAGAFMNAYVRLLRLAVSHRAVTMLACACVFFLSILLFALFNKGTEFFPKTEPGEAYVDVRGPEGQNLDTTDALVRQIEAGLHSVDPTGMTEHALATVGTRGVTTFSLGGGGGANSNVGRVALDFVDLEERLDSGGRRVSSQTVVKNLEDFVKTLTGAEIDVSVEEMGPPTGRPVNVEISGDDFEVLAALAAQVRRRIKDTPGITGLRDDYLTGSPEIRYVVDRARAGLLGLSTAAVANTLRLAVHGQQVGTYRELNEDYDITLRLREQDRMSVERVGRIRVPNTQGAQVPLSAVAAPRYAAGFGAINRIDQKRVVTVSADVTADMNERAVLAQVQQALANMPLPRGYSLSYTGENEDFEKARTFLSKAFFFAVGLIILVLVTEFDSFRLPFIIIITVALSLVGVLLGLLAFRQSFGIIMTGIGCISLAGVVVNNAIVLIDYTGKLRDEGKEVYEAIIEAGRTRLRPVLLTAVTTILGLLPMVVGVSFDFRNFKLLIGTESAQWWGPMAIAVTCGLAFATLLTLVVVPTLYAIMVRAHVSRR